MRVLIVEDDPALREGLMDLLAHAGHRAVASGSGEDGLAAASDPAIELVLLDVMLPGISGIEVCRRLREVRPGLAVIMLTARGSEDDAVAGLRAGADDYVTKPFGTRELLARIEAAERRLRAPEPDVQVIEADGCRIDLGRCSASRGVDTEEIRLTAREAGILRWLYHHRARAVSRAELLETVWEARGDMNTRTVDMTIANLRQKIERSPSEPRIVVTVPRVGYAWGRPAE